MDKRVLIVSVISVILAASLILFTVLAVNGIKAEDSKPATSEVSKEEIEWQEDKKSFLNDSEFLDAYQPFEGIVREEDSNELSMLVSSVERDLRVRVVDKDGNSVSGEKFFVAVEGIGEYKDLDADGYIYIAGIKPGNYYISLKDIEGYTMPEPMKVAVKDTIEFVKLDDISYLIKTEDEINAEEEDTAEHDVESDETEHTEKWTHTEDAVLGIDVSKWNREIDWMAVKESGVKFVIIRCGYRGSKTGALVEDPYFRQNIKGATAAGLDVGIYFFTQAIDQKEAVEEASMALSMVEGYDLKYPIFIDTEGSGGRADSLDVATRTAVCEAFCETIETAGYTSGVYASRSWFYNNVNDDDLSDYVRWLAEYREAPLYTGRYEIWQYTSSGEIEGINGRVDLNLSYMKPLE